MRWPAAAMLCCSLTSPAFACANDEATLFSCMAEDRAHTIELCAVRDDAAGGYQSLQYRYGTGEKAELVFPQDRMMAKQEMSFAHAFDNTTYVWSLRFGNGGYTYRVFGLGDEAGVEVWKNKKRLARVMCAAKPYSSPGDIRRASGCDMNNPFGAAGCSDTAPVKK